MTINNNSISKFSLLLIISAVLSACGGKKTVEVVQGDDITRPPVIEKSTAPAPEEQAADGEAISFDEWRKRREAGQ